MYRFNWSKYTLTKNNFNTLLQKVEQLEPTHISLDTETTGLHITLDKPFFVSIAYINTYSNKGIAIGSFLDENCVKEFMDKTFKNVKKIIFFNAKFDLHMLLNVGIPLFYTHKDIITDVSILARLALPAVPVRSKGTVLKLKLLAKKYIDSEARKYEAELNIAKKKINAEKNKLLKQQGIKVGELKNKLKDKLFERGTLPKEILNILDDEEYDTGGFQNIPRDTLAIYGVYDAIFTAELYCHFLPIVIQKKQMETVELEEKVIYVLFKMERRGFKLNKQYLLDAKESMKEYILERRLLINKLNGRPIQVGQHKEIKASFKRLYDITLEATDKDALMDVSKNKDYCENARRFAKTICELRTLEKWYSTYLIRWLDYSRDTDKVYTSFNQCGTVSGRLSSDFQQFPKEPILKDNGEELFNPRKMVMVPNDYTVLVLIDFSSEELRFQALYTYLVGHPDRNLMRAYVPYECYRIESSNKIPFVLGTEFTGYEWYYLEDDEKWHPTDLHDMTTLKAFPEIKKTDNDFGHYRKMAKCTNFACNYGATESTLIKQFGYSPELAKNLFNAYNSAFPGIAEYKKYVNKILNRQPYITNLFGRRYYGANAHTCCNYLIQGSAADYLKLKLIEIDEYITKNKLKIRMLSTVHDEIIFEVHKDYLKYVKDVKAIMEDLKGSVIPIIADADISYTTWEGKKGINVEDLGD